MAVARRRSPSPRRTPSPARRKSQTRAPSSTSRSSVPLAAAQARATRTAPPTPYVPTQMSYRSTTIPLTSRDYSLDRRHHEDRQWYRNVIGFLSIVAVLLVVAFIIDWDSPTEAYLARAGRDLKKAASHMKRSTKNHVEVMADDAKHALHDVGDAIGDMKKRAAHEADNAAWKAADTAKHAKDKIDAGVRDGRRNLANQIHP